MEEVRLLEDKLNKLGYETEVRVNPDAFGELIVNKGDHYVAVSIETIFKAPANYLVQQVEVMMGRLRRENDE